MARRRRHTTSSSSAASVFDTYDADAWAALRAADHHARLFGQTEIKPEHVLLGIHASGGPTAVALHHAGVTEAALRDVVRGSSSPVASPSADHLPLARRSKEAVYAAHAIAMGRDHAEVTTTHLALALLRQPDGGARGAVEDLAVDGDDLDAVLRRLLDGEAEPDMARHHWRISPREYARMEQGRGRRHGIERLDPSRTAFVVVDLVPFFLEENPYTRGIVPNVNALANAVRGAGGTVAWVLPANVEPTPAMIEHFGPGVAARYAVSAGVGPLDGRLPSVLDVRPGDVVAEKSASSAFFPGRCDLHDTLQALGIDTVLIAGTVANVCCESTARDASTLGYRTVMVADANAARKDRDLNATLHTIYRSFGDVRPTSEVVALLAASHR